MGALGAGAIAPAFSAPPLALLFRFSARGAALPLPSVLGLDAWRMEGRLFAGRFCWAEGAVGGDGGMLRMNAWRWRDERCCGRRGGGNWLARCL